MAIIPLRAYNREIEGLIDNGQLDEAVAHCRHILTTFPKYIASYRLLGKAHLEQQRVSDATDIFQRVLSAVPDDFISNVGMSIIREDENNLDASIWHMELAYEAQPSNVAIQDELRRLYGRRDGMLPPKVRLTRGALSKMYAKGGLFDQAIAELRAAINEDPNRPDLQLLLAQMFFQISQRVEAVETCANILKKLPSCLMANQILAVCLPDAEQSEVIKNYRQSAIAMDPYFAFSERDEISSDQVPENAVNIEKLEWKSGLQQVSEATTQPTWATSLGISLEKQVEEKLPDWLKEAEAPPAESGEQIQPSVSPFIWDTQEVKNIITDIPKPESEIPDWMKDAFWNAASGEVSEKPIEGKTEGPVSLTPEETEVEKADIPDWLRGIAPEGVLGEEAPGTQAKGSDVSIPWLEKHEPGPTDSIIQWLEEKKPETPITPAASEGEMTEADEEEVPDWLKDLDVPIPSAFQEEIVPLKSPEITSETPEAIEEPIIEALESPEAETVPSDEITSQTEKEEIVIPETEELPSPEISKSEEAPAEFADEVPDWLRELAGEGAETAPLAIAADEQAGEPRRTTEEVSTTEEVAISEELPSTELPTRVEEAPQEEPTVVIPEEALSELPFIPEEVIAPEVQISAIEEPVIQAGVIPEETIPTEAPAVIEEPTVVEQQLPPEEELTPEIPASRSEAEVFAWLEGLAAEQGVKEEELITSPEERVEAPPEWVKLEIEPTTEEEIPEQEPQSEEAPALPATEIPDWIKGLGEIPETEEVAEEPIPALSTEAEIPLAEELPSWLQELEQPVEEKEAPVSPTETLELKEEEVPGWLKEISETEPSAEGAAPVQLPAAEEILATPAEQIAELAGEEVQMGEVGEEKVEEKVSEPQPEEPVWLPEVETPILPVAEIPIEAEIEPITETEEITTKTVELPQTAPLKQPVAPVVETPSAELIPLEDARIAITEGQPSRAAEIYTDLIRQNNRIEEVIKDIQDALYRFPVDVNLWVSLGDAYFRTEKLQEALNAYTKAEELVR